MARGPIPGIQKNAVEQQSPHSPPKSAQFPPELDLVTVIVIANRIVHRSDNLYRQWRVFSYQNGYLQFLDGLLGIGMITKKANTTVIVFHAMFLDIFIDLI
jgi:hypothetical protein